MQATSTKVQTRAGAKLKGFLLAVACFVVGWFSKDLNPWIVWPALLVLGSCAVFFSARKFRHPALTWFLLTFAVGSMPVLITHSMTRQRELARARRQEEADKFSSRLPMLSQVLDRARLDGRPFSHGFSGGVVTISPLDALSMNVGYQINPLFLDLPLELKPTSPDDVRTLVLVDCQPKTIGYYGSNPSAGGAGVQANCQLAAIKLSTEELVAEGSVTGQRPAESISSKKHGDFGGWMSDEEIVQGIVQLSVAN